MFDFSGVARVFGEVRRFLEGRNASGMKVVVVKAESRVLRFYPSAADRVEYGTGSLRI